MNPGDAHSLKASNNPALDGSGPEANGAPDLAFLSVTASGHILSWDSGARAFFGMPTSPDESPTSLADLLITTEKRRSSVEEILSRTIKNGRWQGEIECRPPSEPRFLAYGTFSLVPAGTGSSTIIAVYVRKLSESEARFHDLAESIREVFWITDIDTTMIYYVSPAYEIVWGRSCQSLYDNPRSFLESIHPDDRDRIIRELQHQSERYDQDYRIVRPDGTVRWIRDRAFSIRDESGTIIRIAGIAEDVTDRKTMEAALIESEEHYRSLFQNMLNGFAYCRMLFDANGKPEDFVYLSVNNAFEAQTGLKDVVGKRVTSVIPGIKESDPKLFEIYSRVASSGIPEKFETYLQSLDMWFSISVYSPKKDHFVAVFDVVTDRKKSEEALRKSESFSRSLIDHLPQRIFVKDINSVYLSCNPNYAKDLGIKPHEIIGKDDFDFHPKALAEAYRADDSAVIQSGQPKDITEIYSVNGIEKWIRTIKVPYRDTHGNIIGVLGVFDDMTTAKQAEEEIKRSEKHLAEAMELAEAGHWEFDIASQRFTFNDRFYALYGTTVEREGGYQMSAESYVKNFVHPEDIEGVVSEIQRAIEILLPDASWELEHRIVRRDGQIRHIAVRITTIRDAHGKTIKTRGVNQDITERKRLQEQLRQSQKMESIGRLAGGIAHDFNNILTIIRGNVDLIARRLSPDDPSEQDIRDIGQAVDQASSLTRQLLAFSRKQIIQPQVLNLNNSITSMEKMLKRLIGEHIELSIELDPDIPSIIIDAGQIEQVLLNLVINARDAMPSGGRIFIKTALPPIQNNMGASEDRTNVELTVSDTGEGMSEEVLSHIYEPFFTTKPTGKGSGLGLATVYGIVIQNKGTIGVESAPEKGACFKIIFPGVFPSKDQPTAEINNDTAKHGNETILVVEDEGNIRKIMERILVNHGYNVLLAQHGEEALSHFKNNKCGIDLVITDMVMPKMGGEQFARLIRATCQTTKFIFMSGYTDHTAMENFLMEGNSAFLQKPFGSKELLEKIREVLGKPS